MAIWVKVIGHLVTFGWPCQCLVVFKAKRAHPLVAAELDEDFDVWAIQERRGWQWVSETACVLHEGPEVRHYRHEESRRGGRPASPLSPESAAAIAEALRSLGSPQ